MSELTRGKVILYLTAIFLIGAVAGAVGGYTAARQKPFRPPPPPRFEDMATHIRNRYQTKLELTPEQLSKINPLIDGHCADFKAMQKEGMEKMSKLTEKFNQQLAEQLTPEQKVKFEAIEKERRERMHRWGRPPSRPPEHKSERKPGQG